jgi:hypothetical protein
VPNRPKPPKLMSHSTSGQSAEQFQWSNPLGGHASLTAALAGSHLNVTLSSPAASAAANCETQVRHTSATRPKSPPLWSATLKGASLGSSLPKRLVPLASCRSSREAPNPWV